MILDLGDFILLCLISAFLGAGVTACIVDLQDGHRTPTRWAVFMTVVAGVGLAGMIWSRL